MKVDLACLKYGYTFNARKQSLSTDKFSDLAEEFMEFIHIASKNFKSRPYQPNDLYECSIGKEMQKVLNVLKPQQKDRSNTSEISQKKLRKISENMKQKNNNPTSKYSGVTWDRRTSKWRAKLKNTYFGIYSTDVQAAMVVNYCCDANGLERLNPSLGTMEPKCKRIQRRERTKSSTYRGVAWDDKAQHWTAQVTYQNVRIPLGKWKTETLAAKAVNRACTKLNISPRNPAVGF